jgi:cytochrome c peroxidase
MTMAQKRGALLFFQKGNRVSCHAVSGKANEMLRDFEEYNIGVPQISPGFGVGKGNVIFDGPGQNEDFGLEHVWVPLKNGSNRLFRLAVTLTTGC